jgi:hypothetical protein
VKWVLHKKENKQQQQHLSFLQTQRLTGKVQRRIAIIGRAIDERSILQEQIAHVNTSRVFLAA